MRSNCLYCEQDGVDTALVTFGSQRVCPIHSADFIRRTNVIPEGFALVRKPVLTDRGSPTIGGVTYKTGGP